jgi:hypothetical protein
VIVEQFDERGELGGIVLSVAVDQRNGRDVDVREPTEPAEHGALFAEVLFVAKDDQARVALLFEDARCVVLRCVVDDDDDRRFYGVALGEELPNVRTLVVRRDDDRDCTIESL